MGSLNDLGRMLQPELIKLSDLDARGVPEIGDGNVGNCDKPKRIQLERLHWWSGQRLCLHVRLWINDWDDFIVAAERSTTGNLLDRC